MKILILDNDQKMCEGIIAHLQRVIPEAIFVVRQSMFCAKLEYRKQSFNLIIINANSSSGNFSEIWASQLYAVDQPVIILRSQMKEGANIHSHIPTFKKEEYSSKEFLQKVCEYRPKKPS